MSSTAVWSLQTDRTGYEMPAATILITTKDRRIELERAVRSALEQRPECGVLVIDDGSTDGTSDMVRRQFPTVQLVTHAESLGYIVRRNQGVELAQTPYVVSIDDDAAFSQGDIVMNTLADFDHPRIGAVAIPYIDIHRNDSVQQLPPDNAEAYATYAFTGTAHALRRDLFIQLGGYRDRLIHQGEEQDYCIRMLQAGYCVRLGRSAPIHHFESPRRDFRRMDVFGRRNDLLFAWQNVPMPELLAHIPATILHGIGHCVRTRRPFNMARGTISGLLAILSGRFPRTPISRLTYRLYRKLRKCPLLMDQVLSNR